eukprot:Pgem_evm1s2964
MVNLSMIPNQNGKFKKLTELCIDQEIDEELKNAYTLFEIEDYRDKLLHLEVSNSTSWLKPSSQKTIAQVIRDINSILKPSSTPNIRKYDVADHLVACINCDAASAKQKLIYKLCKLLLPSIPEKKNLYFYKNNVELWEEVNKLQIRRMLTKVENEKSLQALAKKVSSMEVMEFLNNFYSILQEPVKESIIPDQNGDLRKLTELYIDNKIDENLKTAYSMFPSCDYRKMLVDLKVNSLIVDGRPQMDNERIIDAINRAFDHSTSMTKKNEVADFLTSCIEGFDNIPKIQQEMYKFCKDLFVNMR